MQTNNTAKEVILISIQTTEEISKTVSIDNNINILR
jgi:hypothetical protein